MARPVCVVASGGSPFVSVSDGPPATPVADGPPITLVEAGAPPICLVNDDGSAWFENVADADYGWDFIANQAIWNSASIGALSNTPNWTFTRASTAYYRNSSGLLTSVASGVLRTGDRGALIEGAGTNLCLRSQDFDNASWTKVQSTISADAVAAPDGTTTADKVIEDSATTVHNVNQAPTTTAASHTFSVYLKAAERTFAMLYHATSNVGTVFNLSTGAAAGNAGVGAPAAATITALANGWYRCTITVTATAAANSFRVYLCSNATTYNYAGDGTSGLYLWGAQLEATAFASSYIPTTTASATRAADSLTVTGVTGLAYPLTFFCEFERGVDTGGSEVLIVADNDSNTDRAYVGVNGSDLAIGSSFVASVQVSAVTVAGALAVGTTYKAATRIDTNNVQAARGGTLGTLDTSAANPATPTTIRFGNFSGGSGACYGYLRRLAIFSRALSDAELQALTT